MQNRGENRYRPDRVSKPENPFQPFTADLLGDSDDLNGLRTDYYTVNDEKHGRYQGAEDRRRVHRTEIRCKQIPYPAENGDPARRETEAVAHDDFSDLPSHSFIRHKGKPYGAGQKNPV